MTNLFALPEMLIEQVDVAEEITLTGRLTSPSACCPWKRGMRYGTLICDLERGMPIDLLPDHSVETVSS
jgi:hypothetical protein